MTALQQQGKLAKDATYVLATAGTAKKNAALAAIADILTERQEEWPAQSAEDPEMTKPGSSIILYLWGLADPERERGRVARARNAQTGGKAEEGE